MSGRYPKGPWRAANSPFKRDDGTEADFWDIRSGDGRYILAIPPVALSPEEHEAFARLIEAAPCLVEALRRLLDFMARLPATLPEPHEQEAYDRARALLARIDGGDQ